MRHLGLGVGHKGHISDQSIFTPTTPSDELVAELASEDAAIGSNAEVTRDDDGEEEEEFVFTDDEDDDDDPYDQL